MYLLKGSVIRKRYILVFWESESEKMDKYLYNYYEIKRKYKKGNFSIYLCNQLNKSTICRLISRKGGNIVTVSGTIKKCKKSLSYTMENNIHLTPSKETPWESVWRNCIVNLNPSPYFTSLTFLVLTSIFFSSPFIRIDFPCCACLC